MKEELGNEQEKETKNSNFFQRIGSVLKKAASSPYMVVGTILGLAGTCALIVAGVKISAANREVKSLKAENMKLGKQLNEAWYQIGKASANK